MRTCSPLSHLLFDGEDCVGTIYGLSETELRRELAGFYGLRESEVSDRVEAARAEPPR